MSKSAGKHIHITGIVQGVGFRPFVYGLAIKYDLTGWVRNTSAGVDIEVNGPEADLEAFVEGLRTESPPLSQIDTMDVEERPFTDTPSFKIVHSEAVADAFQPISPDMCICPDCLREMLDPTDRRYLYPFINCTNCGPRFTIIKDIPYDRPLTTMAPFEMCDPCAEEYNDPLDRRFHAQPVACAECGPHVWIESSQQSAVSSQQSVDSPQSSVLSPQSLVPSPQSSVLSPQSSEEAIEAAREMLANGRILAIKGLGGFHLACDAESETAVTMLRERKLRREKAFAVMMPDLETVKRHCFVNEAEAELLISRERPIVILQRRPESKITPACAPGQDTLGVMLPYTPLHYLLFSNQVSGISHQQEKESTDQGSRITDYQRSYSALVMTSGNLSEEPIAYTNEDARTRLSSLADAFLLHNRDIHIRCDDSVMRILDLRLTIDDSDANRQSSIVNRKLIMPFRRSRGYAPFPVKLPWDVPPILGAGAELKNTFCVANGRYAFLSHHIGDLENYETLQSFEEGVAHFEHLFRVKTELIAYDKHPNYLATRYALERAEKDGIPTIGVQHHHAHIAACMAEHGLMGDEPVIGLSFDGTGYGDDGTIWGGEVLVADYAGYKRPFHLLPVPLPGGDKAVREPWRMALSWLHKANIEWADDLPSVRLTINSQQSTVNSQQSTINNIDSRPLRVQQLTILRHQLKTGINSPLTSSMGRLFDAVSALIGIRQTVNYEAQAAIEMEALADPHETSAYDIPLHENVVDPSPMLRQIVQELRDGVSQATIAARFHNGLVETAVTICQSLKATNGLNNVVLSGGVWQNMTLLSKTVAQLQKNHFNVYIHQKVPTNDGGLALGQVAIAANYLKEN